MSDVAQDGECSSHGSEDPTSPGEEEPDSPCSELRSEENGERVTSINCPGSCATAVLSSRELWQLFDAIGTEMIVTRRGRRMFPAIKVELYDLKPDVSYILLMDMAPVDKYRYKYNAGWVRCFEEECAPTRLYIHPDSPALGSHWTSVVINFFKLKLTNNQLDKQGHIIVNSMHRYQPRLHVVESNDIHSFNWDTRQTFIFPGTQFTTVTAYQNDKITQLKIQTNPFAKGFRTPFSRCRSRNAPGTCTRFTLRSGSCSDSGVEDAPHPSPSSLSHSSPTSLFSPRLLLPSHDSSHLLVKGHDATRILVQGHDNTVAPRVILPGWDVQQLVLPEPDTQHMVLVAAGQDGKHLLVPRENGKTRVITEQDGPRVIVAGHEGQHNVMVAGQKFILPTTQNFSSQADTQTSFILGPDNKQNFVLQTLPGQKMVLQNLQNQDKQKVLIAGQNGQTFVLDQQQLMMLCSNDITTLNHTTHERVSKKRHNTEKPPAERKIARLSTNQTDTTPFVLMYQPVVAQQQQQQQQQLISKALLQPHITQAATSTAYTTTTSSSSSSSISSHKSTPTSTSFIHTTNPHMLITSTPHTSCSTSSPTVVNGLVHLNMMKPVQRISSETKKPLINISCLTKEGAATKTQTPPPLLQISNREQKNSPPQTTDNNQPLREIEESTNQDNDSCTASQQDVVLVQTSPPPGMQRVLVIGEKGETITQPQMVLPVAYDQQLVSMPIYRVGSSLGSLQPMQVLATLPSGGTTT